MKCKVVKVNEVSTVKRSGDGKELKKQDVVCRYGVMKYLSFTAKSSKEMIVDLENVNEEDIASE